MVTGTDASGQLVSVPSEVQGWLIRSS